MKAVENADEERYPGIPAMKRLPKLTTAIFGLGAHDLQPRHLIAAFENMDEQSAPFVYLGSQFFSKDPSPHMAELQDKLRAAYPETELMALQTKPNPKLLPDGALRIRFHSVGGYGTIATGKLLTDILAGALNLHSKAAPKYGSEKSGAPTNYYITLSPEPVKITNADLEEVEVVVSPDHKVFAHGNPLRGLVEGGTFILQSNLSPLEVWKELPEFARKTITTKNIRFFVLDGFAIAKRHAPTPELETRMMGIAFIGAVCGHVERVLEGADQAAVMEKIRSQIAKKFGAKGGAIVDGNMAVIRDGSEATIAVDYSAPEFADVAGKAAPKPVLTAAVSESMCRIQHDAVAGRAVRPRLLRRDGRRALPRGHHRRGAGPAGQRHVHAVRHRSRQGQGPVPAQCAGLQPRSLHRLPGMHHGLPGRGHSRDRARHRRSAADGPQAGRHAGRAAREGARLCPADRRGGPHGLSRRRRRQGVRGGGGGSHRRPRCRQRRGQAQSRPHGRSCRDIAGGADEAVLRCHGEGAARFRRVVLGRDRPLEVLRMPGVHRSLRSRRAQGGGTGRRLCSKSLQTQFEFLSRTPNTPARYIDSAFEPEGDIKRIMLDRHTYYATTGGHGACRGCGEVTAIRQVVATSHALHDRRRKAHIRELEGLIADLTAKLPEVAGDAARKARISDAIDVLEKRLFLMESGPTGNGPAAAVIANATGCSSVYASTFPFNPYNDPWVNSLFQDSPALSKGIFEGLTASAAVDFKAMRIAKLELADAYNPATDDAFLKNFSWPDFTPEERSILPTVISISGDGAAYDIGFGSLSRLLASKTPVKVVVLNSGVYSNTGGQTSTASLSAQDSDLSRFGSAVSGKQEDRKELGLIAAFHPDVFVVQSATAMPGHFLKSMMAYLEHNSSPAVLDVYTPCQAEHGIADAAASRRAKLAVESRVSPVFVHDPKPGASLEERFSLDGNPALDKDWATTTLEYVEDGKVQLMDVPLTPADFARGETRFKKQFRPLKDDADGVPIHEYIDLPLAERAGKTPYVLATDAERHLVRYEVGAMVVHLVEERRKYWRTLQHLAGQRVAQLDAEHHAEIVALRQRYDEAVQAQEATMDSIARGMSELAAASAAPAAVGVAGALAPVAAGAPAAAAPPAANGSDIPHIRDEDMALCTNCKTCYQEVPELFELTRIVVDGEVKEVARTIPGALEKIEVTPQLKARLAKVAANCDGEIVR